VAIEALSRGQRVIERLPGVEFARRVATNVSRNDVPGLAAEIAYHWIFAVPAALILVVMLGAATEQVTSVDVVGELRAQIEERAPADVASVLDDLVDNALVEIDGGAASLGVVAAGVIALWSASNGMAALMKALNRVHGIGEDRPFLRKRLVAIGMTALLVALLNAAFALLVAGEWIGGRTADRLGSGQSFEQGWSWLRIPLAIGVIALTLGLLYTIAPNRHQPVRWVTAGSVAATALWIALVVGFGVYLQIADPGSAYGVLGGVIVFMFFLYLTALILLVGAEVDAALQQRPPRDAG
jgi:membrane protein